MTRRPSRAASFHPAGLPRHSPRDSSQLPHRGRRIANPHYRCFRLVLCLRSEIERESPTCGCCKRRLELNRPSPGSKQWRTAPDFFVVAMTYSLRSTLFHPLQIPLTLSQKLLLLSSTSSSNKPQLQTKPNQTLLKLYLNLYQHV